MSTTPKDTLGITHKNIILGKCPQCKKGDVFDKGAVYGCTQYPDCDFAIPKQILKANISSTTVKQLLDDHITWERIVFTKEEEDGATKEFFAHLILFKTPEGKYTAKFEFNVPLGACPKCKNGKIHERDKCYKCDNKNCGAYAFKSYFGTKLKPSHISNLLAEPFQISIVISTKSNHKRRVMLYLKDVFKNEPVK